MTIFSAGQVRSGTPSGDNPFWADLRSQGFPMLWRTPTKGRVYGVQSFHFRQILIYLGGQTVLLLHSCYHLQITTPLITTLRWRSITTRSWPPSSTCRSRRWQGWGASRTGWASQLAKTWSWSPTRRFWPADKSFTIFDNISPHDLSIYILKGAIRGHIFIDGNIIFLIVAVVGSTPVAISGKPRNPQSNPPVADRTV